MTPQLNKDFRTSLYPEIYPNKKLVSGEITQPYASSGKPKKVISGPATKRGEGGLATTKEYLFS